MANLCLSRNAKKLELNLEHRQKRPSIAHWVEFSPKGEEDNRDMVLFTKYDIGILELYSTS